MGWWEQPCGPVHLVGGQEAEKLKRSFLVLVFGFVKKETRETEMVYW
jgi:hypothetical protein